MHLLQEELFEDREWLQGPGGGCSGHSQGWTSQGWTVGAAGGTEEECRRREHSCKGSVHLQPLGCEQLEELGGRGETGGGWQREIAPSAGIALSIGLHSLLAWPAWGWDGRISTGCPSPSIDWLVSKKGARTDRVPLLSNVRLLPSVSARGGWW